MDALIFGVFSYLYFILVGGLMGLAVLMPRVRALARENPRWRTGLAVFLSLLAFGLSFVLWSLPDFSAETLLPNLLRGLIAAAACAGTVWLLTRGKTKPEGRKHKES